MPSNFKNKDGETVVRSAAWSEKNLKTLTDRRGLPFSNEISKGGVPGMSG